jgi:hypothetical protein
MLYLPSEKVNVAWRDKPFVGKPHAMALPQGFTCAEIIAQVPDIDTRRFLQEGVFCINGEMVPREMWPFVRPKSREDLLVTLHMPIRGGGGGGKDALRIVGAIAILVIASVISAGALSGPTSEALFGAGAFAAGSTSAAIAAGAVTIAGSLLLGAFVKPPSNVAQPKTSNEIEGQAAALSGNVLRRGEPVPRVIGTMRVFPPFLSQPLNDLIEYDEVSEAVYGLAGPHFMEQIKTGTAFLDDVDLDQLEYQIIELSDEDNGIDDNTIFMLHLDGSQDAQSFPDSGPLDLAFNATGAVFIDKDSKWFGLAAAFFGGSDGQLVTPSVPSMFIDTEDFSIDFWFEYDGAAGLEAQLMGHTDSGATAAGSAFYTRLNSSGTIDTLISNGVGFTTITTTSNVTTGRHHYAIAREDGIVRAYVDSIKQSGDVAFASSIPLCSNGFAIGSRGQNVISNDWNGWVDEARFVIGSASGFTGNSFTLRRSPYRLAQPDLIERYGKTITPGILLSIHRITNPTTTQGTRDNLTNQTVPQRSLPQPQSVVVRGVGFDEAWVTLTFTAGLFYTDTGFDATWFNGVAFRVRVRAVGTDTWFNMPEVHIHERRSALFSRMLVFRWDSDLVMPNGIPNFVPLAQKCWKSAYYTVPTQTVTPVGSGGWQADPHFYAGAGDTYFDSDNFNTTGLRNIRITQERAEFFLNGLIDKGPIEVEVKRSQIYIADKFTYATYNMVTDPPADALTDGVYDLFGYALLAGSAVILLKQSNAAEDIQLSRAASVWNSPPIARTGDFAAVYVKVRGRRIDALSILASGLVADWDGTEWAGLNATSNPAPHYRDVLVGDLNDNRISESMVDDEVLVEWRQRCLDLGFECNAVFSGENIDRILDTVASCGYARARQSEVWDVAQDRDFTNIVPTQVFTPRNMNNFRWEKAFLRHRPDGLRVRYSDATDDYNEHTIVVPRLGLDYAGRLEEIRYDGLVTLEEAVVKALYDQEQVVDRFTFYYGDVDVEMLVCRRGDLVVVQHDTLDQFAGFTRILRVTVDGGEVTSFDVDGTVLPIDTFFLDDSPAFFITPTEFFSQDVGVCVRQKDGTLRIFPASVSEDGFTLTPEPPLTGIDADVFERECLVTTGRLLREARRMIVYEIKPAANLQAAMTFVDEAPQLWPFPEPLKVDEEFMRNKIINGDMRLDQRHRGSVATLTDKTTTYTLDRWLAFSGDSVGTTVRFNVQQLATGSPPPGFSDYLRATITSQITPVPTNDRYFIGYNFPQDDILNMDWGLSSGLQMALSFMVRASVAGVYTGAFGNALDTNAYPFTFSIPTANTWYRRIIMIPAPPLGYDFTASGSKALSLRVSLGIGTTQGSDTANQWQTGVHPRGVNGSINLVETLGATFDITGVQFEIAPATTFEWLPLSFQQERAFRYTQVLQGIGTSNTIGQGYADSAVSARIVIPLFAPLASIPPVNVVADVVGNFELRSPGGAANALTSLAMNSPDLSLNNQITVNATVAAGLTTGDPQILRTTQVVASLLVDGELY